MIENKIQKLIKEAKKQFPDYEDEELIRKILQQQKSQNFLSYYEIEQLREELYERLSAYVPE